MSSGVGVGVGAMLMLRIEDILGDGFWIRGE